MDIPEHIIEAAAEAMANYIGEPTRTPLGELTYGPYVRPILAAAVDAGLVGVVETQLRQNIADEIKAAAWQDRVSRQPDIDKNDPGDCGDNHAECHASAAFFAFDTAARVARGPVLDGKEQHQ